MTACATCGAVPSASGRPLWKPLACLAGGAPRGLDDEHADATVERRECVVCGTAFCIRAHRLHRTCSWTCRKRIRAWNAINDPVFRSDGRWHISCRDGASMPYARAVMAGHVGRLLTSSEIVHHRNEDCTDDRLENLQITDRPEHMAIHREQLLAARLAECRSEVEPVRRVRVQADR